MEVITSTENINKSMHGAKRMAVKEKGLKGRGAKEDLFKKMTKSDNK